jgi:hypothetical protein
MRLRPAHALILLALLISGCGSDGDSAGGTEKAEYVDQVNAICEASSADVEDAVAPILARAKQSNSSGTEVVADALEKALPISKNAIADAAALPRPPEDEELLDGFWSSLEDSLPLYEQMIDAIRTGDQGAISKLNTDFVQIAADTRPVAEDYGLISCIPDAPSP